MTNSRKHRPSWNPAGSPTVIITNDEEFQRVLQVLRDKAYEDQERRKRDGR